MTEYAVFLALESGAFESSRPNVSLSVASAHYLGSSNQYRYMSHINLCDELTEDVLKLPSLIRIEPEHVRERGDLGYDTKFRLQGFTFYFTLVSEATWLKLKWGGR